jgi:solute carrier family 45, member 1/2/4
MMYTIALLGVQFTWTLELAHGTPYLISLGLSKTLTALVWLAGPLSGLLVQPLVGYWSDNFRSKYGRRRPFLIIGTVLVVFSVLMISYAEAFAKSIGSIFVDLELFGEKDILNLQILFAVVGFYFLDFSINAVQAMCRSLIVDVAPLESQPMANAWAGIMIGIGNVVGYFIGFLDLPRLFPFLGDTQLKCLCFVTIGVLVSTVAIACFFAKEEPNDPIDLVTKWYTPFVEIRKSFTSLPDPIQLICNTQFLAWMGWFPFLFYSSSWVSGSTDTRLGSLALSINAIVSLVAGFTIPIIYQNTKMFTQAHIWAASMWIFSTLVLSTLFYSSQAYLMVVISTIGISWACALWIPFSLIGEYVNVYTNGDYHLLEDADHLEILDVKPGIVLGIHNVYICLPQFFSTLLSMSIFAWVEHDAFGWAIRVGGISMILAGFLALKTSQVNSKHD